MTPSAKLRSRNRRRVALFSVLVMMSSALTTPGQVGADPPRPDEQLTIIFTQEQADHLSAFTLPGPHWTPTQEQVVEFDRRLSEYLKTSDAWGAAEVRNKLSAYRRQYLGYTLAGTKRIYMNAFCAESGIKPEEWRKSFVLVMDGGACFFQAEYDPVTKTITRFSANGSA